MTTALASPLFHPPEEGPLLRRALLAAVAVELLVIGNMAFFFRQEKPQSPSIPPMQLALIAPEPAKVIPPSPRPAAQPKATPKPMPKPVAKPLPRPVTQPVEAPRPATTAPSPLPAAPSLPSPVNAPPVQNANPVKSDPGPREDRAGEGQYAGRVAGEIEKHKVYPASAKELDMTGDVVLAYTISRQGSVMEASVLKSSGFKLLDETALKALRASRFDAMTAGLWPGAPSKTFTTTVHFALDD